jgi:DNA-binding NtrC family response regulator
MSLKAVSILILDDDRSVANALKQYLSEVLHHHVTTFGFPDEALSSIKKSAPDILICDLHLPQTDGISFIKMVKELEGNHPEIIIITGYGEKQNAIECLRLGAIDFLEKPFPLETLKASIDRVIKFIGRKEHPAILPSGSQEAGAGPQRQKFELVGNSRALDHIRGLMEKISKTNDTSVMITGETGVGKEVVARQIHQLSHRRNRPFYAKNCSAIPEQLFESEFFGHVKGAFTNAIADHKGWFETAHDSTLFLDEISELPLSMQPKLLRVLEEKTLNRVGSSVSLPLNVRVIAASNTDLQGLCNDGKFRKDLYYRLNIFSINIPPLRDRREDIPALFDHFLALSVQQHHKEPLKVSKDAYDLLLNYPFPGNVRELKTIAERIVILSDEPVITAGSLTLVLPDGAYPGQDDLSALRGISQQEADLIVAALRKSDNVIARAARILKITDQSLLRRIRKFGITFPV